MGKLASEIEGGIRAALRYCSLEATGLWCLMRYVIDESDRPGHLRQNGRPLFTVQLAREAGCTADTVTRLQQELIDAGLIVSADRTWHSPQLARLASLRLQTAARVQAFRERQSDGGKPRRRSKTGKADATALRNAGCNADVTPDVTQRPPTPSLGFSPTPPLPTPSPDPPFSNENVPVEAAPSAEGSATRPRKQPTEPPPDFRRLTDFWRESWAAAHGGQPVAFDKTDGVMLASLWNRVDRKLEPAKAVITAYLAEQDRYYEGHPLTLLKRDVMKFITRARSGQNGANHANGNNRRAPARGLVEKLAL